MDEEVLGAVKRIMRERGGPSLLMTIAVLGWSIEYLSASAWRTRAGPRCTACLSRPWPSEAPCSI